MVRPEPLFLRRCDQVALLVQSRDNIELLDLGRILRQILLDQHSLIHTVNKKRLKVRFRVVYHGHESNKRYSELLKTASFHYFSLLDPFAVNRQIRLLTVDDFINYPLIFMSGEQVSVREVIRHASNVAGGVHYDPSPGEEYKRVTDLLDGMKINGLPAQLFFLREIGLVTLDAVDHLRADLIRRELARLAGKPPS